MLRSKIDNSRERLYYYETELGEGFDENVADTREARTERRTRLRRLFIYAVSISAAAVASTPYLWSSDSPQFKFKPNFPFAWTSKTADGRRFERESKRSRLRIGNPLSQRQRSR